MPTHGGSVCLLLRHTRILDATLLPETFSSQESREGVYYYPYSAINMITKRREIFWPPVSDLKDIQSTIRVGCVMAFFCAGIWGVGVLFGSIAIMMGKSEAIAKTIDPLIHLTIAIAIGWGILKKFRVAPVAGLVFSGYSFISNWVTNGLINTTTVIMVVNAWAFIHATRGIFAYHKIRKPMEREKTSRV